MSGTETPPGADKDHGLTATKWQVAGAVLVAVLGVVAAVLAILPRDDDGGDSSAGADPTESSTTTTSTPNTTTTSTPTTTTSVDPPIYRQSAAAVAVPAQYWIDLDSSAPDWDVKPGGGDIYVSPSVSSITTKKLAIVRDPTFAKCEAATDVDINLEPAETVVGQQVCILTSNGRWAYVRIADIDADAETMSFDIVVWKLPTDP
jgi:hypothetical protein